LDHYNLPVVAGDCLLALLITLRQPASCTQIQIPLSRRPAGMVFSVIVKYQTSTKHLLCQSTPRIFLSGKVIAAVQ
jgi:hypothetical protein